MDALPFLIPPEAQLEEPPLEYFDEADLDLCPSGPRFDVDSLQLESAGVTSHANEHRNRLSSQVEFWRSQDIWHETIVCKLDSSGRSVLADAIRDCHSEELHARCCGCRKSTIFFNRCETKWCPLCAPALAHERRESIEWWAQRVENPLHVVLTVRNAAILTKEYVRWFKDAFSRLRRSKMARAWRGGFYSLEVTNEGRGWHLHLHALVDCRYIDARQLSETWARIVGQDFAIVKVKSVRDKQYLAEVTKYAVKGSVLASWTGNDIAAFVQAFDGVRTFGVFGSLYGKRTEWREWIESIAGKKVHTCECGCTNFRVLDKLALALDDFQPLKNAPSTAPPSRQFALPF